ncbi:helix-turn-helix transcriptional regulator [Tomitella fengzijianii]|uniref:Helix-turn-helix domain-containing protein n=1 Tax=Tomitella fengzijianii TaxID=2597660 RepID=A0A516X696_9ACTN|nr:helix-turn-helix domain-containing protein [Tomitella fengzijianii]QDQ98589.1 helix-turn-helix domain-containing protein [Tomitella fengzijianii]
MAASSRARTHSALASPSRVALLDHIRGADEPLDAHRLAEECDLHVTTVRFHLDALIGAGLITSRPAPSNGRGRPRLMYSPVAQARPEEEDPYIELSRLLLIALDAEDGASAADRAEIAGYRWAEQSLNGSALDDGPAGLGAAAGKINALFTELGFEADHTMDADEDSAEITLHECPFGAVAREKPAIVCRIHLGLLRGALDHLKVDHHTEEIEPWVTPTTCRAVIRGGGAADA